MKNANSIICPLIAGLFVLSISSLALARNADGSHVLTEMGLWLFKLASVTGVAWIVWLCTINEREGT